VAPIVDAFNRIELVSKLSRSSQGQV